ncbi:MAG: phage tail protein [Lachnospiraceae bacterium]|nr:phage tail protein [Lachnospiraceae bacterium]
MTIAGQYHFRVTIDNQTMSFAKLSNMERSMEYEVLQEGGNNLAPRLLPLPQKQIKTLRLERGVRESGGTVINLYPGRTIKNGISVSLLDAAGNTIADYTITGVTVVKWELGGLDAQSSNVLLETFEMTYTGIKQDS